MKRNKYNWIISKGLLFLICGSIFISSNQIQAQVRTISVNTKGMAPIYLQMGKSTILHFIEKPLKVVVGNQNYVHVEFTSHDITIQPLGVIVTNLFVYTEYRRYGFILKVSRYGRYDDLVEIRWKSRKLWTNKNRKNAKVSNNRHSLMCNLGTVAQIKILRINHNKARKLLIMDVEIKLLSEKKLLLDQNTFSLYKDDKMIPMKYVVYDNKVLDKEINLGVARIIFGSIDNRNLVLKTSFNQLINLLYLLRCFSTPFLMLIMHL
jgi:hypothetical protein